MRPELVLLTVVQSDFVLGACLPGGQFLHFDSLGINLCGLADGILSPPRACCELGDGPLPFPMP